MVVEFINQDRRKLAIPPVEFSEDLSRLADDHCWEMLQKGYASHWNRAGWKPYMRYSQGGILDHTSENISSMTTTDFQVTFGSLQAELGVRHESLISEKAPRDMHRKSILNVRHTHVGIGLAYGTRGVRMIEIFSSGRYVSLWPLPQRVRPSSKLELNGKILKTGYELQAISLFYDALPKKQSGVEFMATGSYDFPDNESIFRPRLSKERIYEDGTRGSVKVWGRSFSQTISIPSQKGVYTVVIWIQDRVAEQPFMVANASLFVE